MSRSCQPVQFPTRLKSLQKKTDSRIIVQGSGSMWWSTLVSERNIQTQAAFSILAVLVIFSLALSISGTVEFLRW